ncbi:MAG: thioredoxin [Candidatus Micrarchaeaceae archaeon]|jgi:thioredoxin 1
MSVIDVNDSTFDSEVVQSKIPVVVDIWAPWCGPCRLYGPIVDEVSKDYEGKVKFVKINADECESTVSKFSVSSIPTTLLIEKGQLKAMNVGAVPKETLKKWITQNM